MIFICWWCLFDDVIVENYDDDYFWCYLSEFGGYIDDLGGYLSDLGGYLSDLGGYLGILHPFRWYEVTNCYFVSKVWDRSIIILEQVHHYSRTGPSLF